MKSWRLGPTRMWRMSAGSARKPTTPSTGFILIIRWSQHWFPDGDEKHIHDLYGPAFHNLSLSARGARERNGSAPAPAERSQPALSQLPSRREPNSQHHAVR